MKCELDDELCNKYPKVFKDRRGDMRRTLMCWGFSCGDGWYEIINRACASIQSYVDHTRDQRLTALRYNRALRRATEHGDTTALLKFYTIGDDNSWAKTQVERTLMEPRYREVPKACPQVIAVQVKEKFGRLEFYYAGGDNYVRGVISMAGLMSVATCDVCGHPGTCNTTGWIACRCNNHIGEFSNE